MIHSIQLHKNFCLNFFGLSCNGKNWQKTHCFLHYVLMCFVFFRICFFTHLGFLIQNEHCKRRVCSRFKFRFLMRVFNYILTIESMLLNPCYFTSLGRGKLSLSSNKSQNLLNTSARLSRRNFLYVVRFLNTILTAHTLMEELVFLLHQYLKMLSELLVGLFDNHVVSSNRVSKAPGGGGVVDPNVSR